MTAIHEVLWADIPQENHPDRMDPSERLGVVWPSPGLPHAILARLGVDRPPDHGDGRDDAREELWDVEWKQILGSLFEALRRYGAPRLRNQDDVVENVKPRRRDRLIPRRTPTRPVDLSPLHRLRLSTADDQFDPAEVTFGDPWTVTARTSDGLAMLWIVTKPHARLSTEDLAREAAAGRPVRPQDLDWSALG